MNQADYRKALDWFLERVPLTENELAEIQEEADELAWLVASNMQLRLCQAVLDRIDSAQGELQPFDEFKKELVEWFP